MACSISQVWLHLSYKKKILIPGAFSIQLWYAGYFNYEIKIKLSTFMKGQRIWKNNKTWLLFEDCTNYFRARRIQTCCPYKRLFTYDVSHQGTVKQNGGHTFLEDIYYCICIIFGNHMVGVTTYDMLHMTCDMCDVTY